MASGPSMWRGNDIRSNINLDQCGNSRNQYHGHRQ
jgi:hypothetical protein